jgi:hypothetical protein
LSAICEKTPDSADRASEGLALRLLRVLRGENNTVFGLFGLISMPPYGFSGVQRMRGLWLDCGNRRLTFVKRIAACWLCDGNTLQTQGENMSARKPSRGVRNNNPGNIEKSRDRWVGLADVQPDDRFFTFSEARFGIRAMARILQNYQKKHKLETVSEMISRWAPPNENDTTAYIRAVCRETGFDPEQKLDMKRHAHLFPLVKAVIRHENGYAPYSDGEINAGLVLAGVVPGAPPRMAANRNTAEARQSRPARRAKGFRP